MDGQQAPEGRHASDHLRRDRLARQLLQPRAVPRPRRARGVRLRRHAHRNRASAVQDRSLARRSVIRRFPLRLARIPGALGPEGGKHQQRANGARREAAVVGADRVGSGTAEHEHRSAERHGVRTERGQLLLRRRDGGRDGFELVAHPSGAVRRACASGVDGTAHGLGDDNAGGRQIPIPSDGVARAVRSSGPRPVSTRGTSRYSPQRARSSFPSTSSPRQSSG